MMEFEIDKESTFTLEMKIDGDVSSAEPPKMRFSIMNEGLTISLNADRVGNGIYKISVPKLKGILEAGEYEANVEVFIDGKHFVPLKESIKLKQEMKPTVKIQESVKPITEMSVSVKPVAAHKEQLTKPILHKTDKIVEVKSFGDY